MHKVKNLNDTSDRIPSTGNFWRQFWEDESGKNSINAVVGGVLKKLRTERMFKKRIVMTDIGILCHCVTNVI